MKKVIFSLCLMATYAFAQEPIKVLKQLPATGIRNQGATGTCWCFSMTALLEAECLRKSQGEVDLSEMFTVRNIYLEKARNYVLRQGTARFDEGGLGHDVINAMSKYGAMPESAYSGLKNGQSMHVHSKLVKQMKNYLDSLIKKNPLPPNWIDGITTLLDESLGRPPQSFDYQGKTYTAKTFANEVLHFNADDYVYLTSFSHHPYYTSFIVEVPDNFSNGSYFNVPLDELFKAVDTSIDRGYSVLWDADVSNSGWRQGKGYAMELADKLSATAPIEPDLKERPYSQEIRQQLYENYTTTDDHLMLITGTAQSKGGKKFYQVKNSWGLVGPYKGYIYVSESYFALNTVTLVLPKAALSTELKAKMSLK
ncbi:MAG: C1 family peptidase [Spirosomataceae bacterium]